MGFQFGLERLPLRYFSQRSISLAIMMVVGLVLYLHLFHTTDLNHRYGGKPSFDGSVRQFNSICSPNADRRGPHQKVIAYSLYGNFSKPNFAEKYLKFFRQTLNKIPLAYTGWVVRIYHNLTIDDVEGWKILESAVDFGSHIDLCNATEIIKKLNLADIFAMTWRWLPLLDEMVDMLMSRDTDSKIIVREEDAVREWLTSSRTFHIMRDNPQHCRFIVGCCWGVKISQDRITITEAAKKMFHENHRHEYDYDQKLLDRLFWPIATTNLMAHDSFCCEKIPHGQPYPTKRIAGIFIGDREIPREQITIPCPPKCRPVNKTAEWEFC